MRLFVFNVLMFGALMLGWVSCQEYESGTYPLEESTVRYEGRCMIILRIKRLILM